MIDAIPYVLAGALAVALIIGVIQYRKFLKTPWDEWDETDLPQSPDQKD